MSSQSSSPGFASAEAAELGFYAAFERGDIAAMIAVWSEDPDISCIHPMGPVLRGPSAIGDSWRQILAPQHRLRITLSHQVVFSDAHLCVHCVHENIHHGDRFEDLSVIIATNAYRFDGQGWRMILHHASPGARPARAPSVEPVPPDRAVH
ncbi:MAG: nuclear transport factor 2 family protein [Gammaproteobacteria bacterium]|nr:nuclear transport factor 2 family protein [Gammaproteobacteria bacterium]